jgi:hypothetical protein
MPPVDTQLVFFIASILLALTPWTGQFVCSGSGCSAWNAKSESNGKAGTNSEYRCDGNLIVSWQIF